MMRVSVGLTAAYALIMALAFYPGPAPDLPSRVEWLLIAEASFAGPMIIAGVLSILMRRVETRRVMVVFQVAYVLITLAIYYSTFTGEHDAQYQLALLFIPIFGFVGVVAASLIAACLR